MQARGRAYRCSKCPQYVEERSKVESHFLKNHVALDRAKFYCTLCSFRCNTKAALKNHVKRYTAHVDRVKQMKPEGKEVDKILSLCLKESEDPYVIKETDVIELPVSESPNTRRKRSKNTGTTLTQLTSTEPTTVSSMQPLIQAQNVTSSLSEISKILKELLTRATRLNTAIDKNTDMMEALMKEWKCNSAKRFATGDSQAGNPKKARREEVSTAGDNKGKETKRHDVDNNKRAWRDERRPRYHTRFDYRKDGH
ncbi:uncharacterized protein LOC121374179 isoform X2 [Gigantopelta aegis]|nr:uncharacterized protein LOC121374179 isoform X2 [Gigantopelta aegis]